MKRSHPMSRSTLMAFVAMGAGLGLASAVQAQETPGQARARATTQSLNQAPADTTLGTRPTATPLAQSQAPARRQGRTLTDVLNQTADAEPAAATRAPAPAAPAPTRRAAAPVAAPVAETETPAPDIVPVLAELPVGPMSALPPLPLGYYVRGDMACNQIWPGEGNLAWLSEIAFTIDFGGCDPGAITQVSDTAWHEDQRCQTELGGDAGLYSIDYEAGEGGTLITRTKLPADPTPTEDVWKPCAADEVPAEARFHPDDPGRAT